MQPLLLLIAACLTGCGTNLTVISPPIDQRLLAKCGDKIADPLTSADQYDTARALSQATKYATTCAARQEALVDAVQARDQLLRSVEAQINKGK